jgi:hypothetical protein
LWREVAGEDQDGEGASGKPIEDFPMIAERDQEIEELNDYRQKAVALYLKGWRPSWDGHGDFFGWYKPNPECPDNNWYYPRYGWTDSAHCFHGPDNYLKTQQFQRDLEDAAKSGAS